MRIRNKLLSSYAFTIVALIIIGYLGNYFNQYVTRSLEKVTHQHVPVIENLETIHIAVFRIISESNEQILRHQLGMKGDQVQQVSLDTISSLRNALSQHEKLVTRYFPEEIDILNEIIQLSEKVIESALLIHKEVGNKISEEELDPFVEQLEAFQGESDRIIERALQIEHHVLEEENKKVAAVLSHMNQFLISVTLSLLLLSLLWSIWMAQLFSRPITHLTNIAIKVANGDLGIRADIKSEDEVGKLAKNFNIMLDDLNNSLVSKGVENIIQSMQDALLVLNASGDIQTVNQATLQLLEYEEQALVGNSIVSILKNEEGETSQEIDLEEFIQKERVFSIDQMCVAKNGRQIPVQMSSSVMRNNAGKVEGVVIVLRDMTEYHKTQSVLEYQAAHDKLTGLSNRQSLTDRLSQAISYATCCKKKLIVALIDLDNFKYVNDAYGHAAGDTLLKTVADRLQQSVRNSDTVARFGGDEFVLIMNDVERDDITVPMVNRIIENVAQPVLIGGIELQTTCSMGLSVFPSDGQDVDTLLKAADIAMYHAKEEGRNIFQFFTPELQQKIIFRVGLEDKLRKAIDANEFQIVYQPKVNLNTGNIVGAEALLRWFQPELGPVSPDQFIPMAEEIGFIVNIDEWVLDQVCLQCKTWRDNGLPLVPIAINLSAVTFMRENLEETIDKIFRKYGIQEGQIVLEITETASMKDPEKSIEAMQRLRNRRIELSVDDFGSGYSNLSYLKRFPVSSIKIDRCFVSGLADNTSDFAIVQSIISMAHSLGMKVIGEGVETEEQLRLLASKQCDEMQGFYFSKPLEDEKFIQLLRLGAKIDAEKLGRKQNDRALLIVDDDKNMLSSIKRVLGQEDCDLFLASSADEALNIISKNEIAVVLTDYKMPMMTGIEMLSQIKLRYPETTRILMSAVNDRAMAVDAINRGEVFKFLEKPLDMTVLKEALEEAFIRHTELESMSS